MAAGWLCVASLSLFILSQSIISEAHNHRKRGHDHKHGDDHKERRHHHQSRCHELSKAMGSTCDVKEDCSNITCASTFGDQPVFLSALINKCRHPMSLGLAVRVPSLGVDWSHTFEDGDSISIPNFPLSVEGVVSAQVNVTVKLEEAEDNKLKVKVELLGGGEIAGREFYPMKKTVMDGELPIDTDDCLEFERTTCYGWVRNKWRHMPWQARAAIVAGSLLFLMLLVSVCCCLCRKSAKKGKKLPKVFIKPSPDVMTTYKSKVPLERLTSDA